MFSYYVELGLRSLLNQKLVTAWTVLLIALGVAGTVTTFAVLQAVSSNPFASKSHRLFTPQIDNHGPDNQGAGGRLDPVLTLRDVQAFRANDGGELKAAVYPIELSLVPTDTRLDPLEAKGYAVTVDYFEMLEAPFRFGAPWSKTTDEEGGADIVIGDELNTQLFRGVDSVGRELRVEGHVYRISGVLSPWNPLPRFYAAVDGKAFDSDPPQIFFPLRLALEMKLPTAGGSYGEPFNGWDAMMKSENSFISYWVELPDAAAAARYRNFLYSYAEEQRAIGRFNWPPNVELRDQADWLKYQHVVPPESRISFVVALGLLAVCAINTVGLLLARFMRRASDIGIRRALGGSKSAILLQTFTEAGVIGLVGGVLGIALTICFVNRLDLVFPAEIAQLTHITWQVLLTALVLSMSVVLLAAIFPVMRTIQIAPGWHLKTG